MRKTLDSRALEPGGPSQAALERRAEFVRSPWPWEPEAECTCFDGVCMRDHENE